MLFLFLVLFTTLALWPGLFGRSLLLRPRLLLSLGAGAGLLLGLLCPLTLRLFGARLRLLGLLTPGGFALPLFLGALWPGFLGPISLRAFGLWFLLLGPALPSLFPLGAASIRLLLLLRCWLLLPLILFLLLPLCPARLLRLLFLALRGLLFSRLLLIWLRTPLFAWLLLVGLCTPLFARLLLVRLRTALFGFLRRLLLIPRGATFFSLFSTPARPFTRLRGARVRVLWRICRRLRLPCLVRLVGRALTPLSLLRLQIRWPNVLWILLLHLRLKLLAVRNALPAMLEPWVRNLPLHLFGRHLLLTLLHRRCHHSQLIPTHSVEVTMPTVLPQIIDLSLAPKLQPLDRARRVLAHPVIVRAIDIHD